MLEKWPYIWENSLKDQVSVLSGGWMSLRDNKMAILRQLGLESEPISLPELMFLLGSTFKERSVRRWLNLLVETGAVKKVGQKRGTKYMSTGRSEEVDSSEISSCF